MKIKKILILPALIASILSFNHIDHYVLPNKTIDNIEKVENKTSLQIVGVPSSVNVGDSFKLETNITSVNNETNHSVTWSTTNKNILAIDSDGLVTAKSEGQVKITASSKVDGSSISSSVTITVSKKFTLTNTDLVTSLEVNPKNITLKEGQKTTLYPEIKAISDTYKKVKYESNDVNIASVNENGIISAVSVGTTVIKVTAIYNTNFVQLININVEKALEENKISSITVSSSITALEVGNKTKVKYVVNSTGIVDKRVTFTSSNPSILRVDQTGLVTALKEGKADVIVSSLADSNIQGKLEFTISKKTIESKVISVTLDKTVTSIEQGKTLQLQTDVQIEGNASKEVEYSSSNLEIASVDDSGLVTAIKEGNVTIKVVSIFDPTKTDTITLTISPKPVIPSVESVEITNKPEETDKFYINDTFQVKYEVSVLNDASKEVEFTSSNNDIASVDTTGLVTFKTIGEVTISVISKLDSSKKDSFTITVLEKAVASITKITLTPTSSTIKINETVTLTASIEGEGEFNKEVSFESLSPDIASVDEKGVVTGLVKGSATIKVTSKFDNTKSATAIVNVIDSSTPEIEGQAIASGLLNQIDLSWNSIANAKTYKVEYKSQNDTTFKVLNENLVQSDKFRASIIGISAGIYQTRVIPLDNSGNEIADKILTNSDIVVSEYDTTGYAHYKNQDNPGAYKKDGTLKDDAIVIYVNEQTKNSQITLEGKTYNGFGEVLNNASTISKPINVVFTSQITDDVFEDKKFSSKDLYNTFQGKYEKLNGAMTQIGSNGYDGQQIEDKHVVYDATKKASSSYFNMMYVKDASNITIEGVFGAGLYQWGMDFARCNQIEVRNLSFQAYPEDALCFEGVNGQEGEYGNYFFHHNSIYLGKNGWAFESDKEEGDGGFDVKRVHNVTCSYNTFNNLHKAGLIGSSDDVMQYNMSYHHNLFNTSQSRLPLIRQANAHYYNNYYYHSKTCMDARASAYIFSENNYFECLNSGSNYPQQVKSGAVIKSYNDIFTGRYSDMGSTIVSSRSQKVANSCKPAGIDMSNFENDPDNFYATDVTNITNFFATSDVPNKIPNLAGYTSSFTSSLTPKKPVIDHNGSGEGGESGGDSEVGKDLTPISEDTNYNFSNGNSSNEHFYIKGNLKKSELIYEGTTYTQGLKMESSTLIKFTIEKDMDLLLVASGSDGKNISINGSPYEVSKNAVKVSLKAGTYEISKDDSMQLFYIGLTLAK